MQIRVWLDAWQMQCCGRPFRDGDVVSWTLSSDFDKAWLTDVVGAELVESIDYYEERHGDLPDDAPETEGVVKATYAIRCRYQLTQEEHANVYVPEPGTTDVTQVHEADGWETEDTPLEFVGYLVDLDVSEVTASPPYDPEVPV